MTDLDFSGTWSADRLTLTVRNGSALFTDRLDPVSAAARQRVAAALLKVMPTISEDALRALDAWLIAQADRRPAAAAAQAGPPPIVDPDPEPWPDAVDGAALLLEIASVLDVHVVLPAHGSIAASLWALLTYVYDRFEFSPRLLFNSATMRSGKTLALRLLGALVARPLTTEGISAAALYRIVESVRPTMLLDEADTYLASRREPSESAEALRGVVNSGFQRHGRFVKCQGDEHEPRAFRTFAPVALAMIGEPPATIRDRCIVLRMRRRSRNELVDLVRPGRPLREQHLELVRRCRRWGQDHGDELAEAVPAIPPGMDDRRGNCWWPLLAIADSAGGDWPDLAREAAIVLSTTPPDDEEAGIRLLADLRAVFGIEERLPSAEVLRLLNGIDSAPWSTWHRGGPLTSHGLARLLRPFGITPRNLRVPSGSVSKGYSREDLQDAFGRYLPQTPPS